MPHHPSLTPTTATRTWTARAAWALPVLLAMVGAVYAPGLGGGFAFDDFPNIVSNAALRVGFDSGFPAWLSAAFSSPASDLQRPLAMATFALNHALTGLDPWWMKATNVGIHLVNILLVFALCRRLLRRVLSSHDSPLHPDAIALWIAAAWALNPINLPAVLLVVQRMESLSHVFVLSGLWLYVCGRERMLAGDRRGGALLLLGVPAATAAGLLAKESAALLPVYALALEVMIFGFCAPDGRSRDRGVVAFFACVLVLPAAVGLVWLLPRVLTPEAYATRNFTLGERLLTEGRVVVDYLRWTLLPDLSRLSLYHDDYLVSRGWLSPPSTAAAVGLLALLATASLFLRTRRPLLALGIAWFLLAHLLTATIVPLELVFEHRNYFASLGLCFAAADALLVLPSSRGARYTGVSAALAAVAFFAGSTAARAYEWRDPLDFAQIEAARHPMSPRATYSLARELIIRTGYRVDSPELPAARRALAQAMRAPQSSPLPEAAAILLEARLRDPAPPAYWTSLQAKLESRPLDSQATTALAALVDCQLQHQCDLPRDDMANSFRAALARGPNAEILNIQGNYVLNVLGDRDLGLQLWRTAAQLAPDVVQYQATMARMLIASGRASEAAVYIRRVRALGRAGQNDSLASQLEASAKAIRR